ncbi:hypothetical protein [Microbacterium aurantiacum]|uniref:hypothetical protein n=1 Tax=Microbacterium aurantiacum TaxID=162393 RepID=UPI003D7589DA
MNPTLSDVLTAHDVDVLDHLDRQAAVPLVDFGRQGDVLVTPQRLAPLAGTASTPVPPEGIAVVRGENGGNTHLLVADGPVLFDPVDARIAARSLRLGTLDVPDGAVAFLIHPEHGAIGFTPGRYTISRQREQREFVEFIED